MAHFILKYLMVIGVVLLGFQHNAFADEKDKDANKDKAKVTKTDSIKIKVNLDIQADDTLVFDDFDEDDDDDGKQGDNSSIAFTGFETKTKTSNFPSQLDSTPYTSATNNSQNTTGNDAQTQDIDQSSIPAEIKVYPNPAAASDDNIFIEHNLSGTVQMTVYSLTGGLTHQVNTENTRILIPGLPAGMYIVNVSGDGKSESKKLLVQ